MRGWTPSFQDPTMGPDPFGRGGITWALDNIMASLEDASRQEDARAYANLAYQLAVVVAPKLSSDEYKRLTQLDIVLANRDMKKRDARREYERLLFVAARANVAEILRLISDRGIYAKPDESPPPPEDAARLAIKD